MGSIITVKLLKLNLMQNEWCKRTAQDTFSKDTTKDTCWYHTSRQILYLWSSLYCLVAPFANSSWLAVGLISQQESVLILHCRRAVRVSDCKFFLQSVCIFLTWENTLSQSALLWGRHNTASITTLKVGKVLSPMGVFIFRISIQCWSSLESVPGSSSISWNSSNSSFSCSLSTKGVNLLDSLTTESENKHVISIVSVTCESQHCTWSKVNYSIYLYL